METAKALLERPIRQIAATIYGILALGIIVFLITGASMVIIVSCIPGMIVYVVGAYRHSDDTLKAYGLR